MSDSDSTLRETIRRWVADIEEREGLAQAVLAKRIGMSQSSLSRMKTGDTELPRASTVARIVARFPANVPAAIRSYLERNEIAVDMLTQSQPRADRAEGEVVTIPIWGVHPVARTGEFHLNPHPVAHLRCPLGLRQARHLAAFYAPDDSMAPRWAAGEPVVVDLSRPASVGHYALIRLSNGVDANGEEVFVFRRIVRRGDGRLWVRTDDPEVAEVGIPLDRVLEPRRILDWKDLLT